MTQEIKRPAITELSNKKTPGLLAWGLCDLNRGLANQASTRQA